MKRPWLKAATWTVVTELNRQLCAQRHAAHLCHHCHRLAPFLNYNGNTFVAVARQAIAPLSLSPTEAAALRSLIGHIVAGTAEPSEQEQFLRFLRKLDARNK